MVESRELYNNPKGLPRLEPSAHDPIAIPTSLPDSPGALAALIANYTAMLASPSLKNNPGAKALIQSMIGKAEIRKSELEADANMNTAIRLAMATGAATSAYGFANDSAFSKAMFAHFNPDEQRYFDSINPTQNYKILGVDKDGNLTDKKLPDVSGSQLREDFARLKFHTLSPDEQKKIREQTPAETSPVNGSPDSSKPLAEPAKPGTLQADKQEMQQLQESMTRLEGHEAQKTVEKHGGATAAAKAEIKERSGDFKEAREISGAIIERVEKVEKQEQHVKGLEAMAQIPIPMMPNLAAMVLPVAKDNLEREKKDAANDIKEKKEELKEAIQEGVINNGLLGKDDAKEKERKKEETPTISAATDVSRTENVAPKTVAAAAPERNQSPAIS